MATNFVDMLFYNRIIIRLYLLSSIILLLLSLPTCVQSHFLIYSVLLRILLIVSTIKILVSFHAGCTTCLTAWKFNEFFIGELELEGVDDIVFETEQLELKVWLNLHVDYQTRYLLHAVWCWGHEHLLATCSVKLTCISHSALCV